MKTFAWGGLIIFLVQVALCSALHLEFAFTLWHAILTVAIAQTVLGLFIAGIVDGGNTTSNTSPLVTVLVFLGLLPSILMGLFINALQTGDPFHNMGTKDRVDVGLPMGLFIAAALPQLLLGGLMLGTHLSFAYAFFMSIVLWCVQYAAGFVSSEIAMAKQVIYNED